MQYFHRQPLRAYYNVGNNDGNKNYVFFVSNLWGGQERLNNTRKKFIEFCKKNESIEFEGGFVNRLGHAVSEEYEDLMIPKRYSHKEYLKKMSKSTIAFNTPAVHNCHGWKITEYFCMGKVILSTPFYNQIPQGIQDGENILFVDEDNIEKILHGLTKEKIRSLRRSSRLYWEEYASPKACVNYIINTALSEK